MDRKQENAPPVKLPDCSVVCRYVRKREAVLLCSSTATEVRNSACTVLCNSLYMHTDVKLFYDAWTCEILLK